jgi:hypothetical protein
VRDVKLHSELGRVQNEALDGDRIPPPEVVRKKFGKKIPKRIRELLSAKVAQVGERSDRLWEIECGLLQCGCSPEETLSLVRGSVWNKYAGQRREIPQLWHEIQKAVKQVKQDRFGDVSQFHLTLYSDFLEEPVPSEIWTVEGIWSYDAHGLIAGEPKTFKSFVATDLAVSVASGTKFLGHFEVPEVGPVILIQEENTVAMMKDRLEKISAARGLFGRANLNGSELELEAAQELPIYLMNNQRFNLTEEDHLVLLENWIKEIKPRLIVLDPIYLMVPGVDENSAVAMTPVLRDLLTLKQKYDVGILIVHHYNKPRSDEDRHPGNRISGTNVFYRWFESALYLSKGQTPGSVVMVPEHRGAAPVGAIHLDFDIGEMGELDYHVDVEVKRESGVGTLRRELKARVESEPGIELGALSEALGITKPRCLRLIERMGFVVRAGESDGRRGRPPTKVFPVTNGSHDYDE